MEQRVGREWEKGFLLMNHKKRNMVFNICLFVGVMVFTFWSVFRNQNFAGITASIKMMSIPSIAASIFLAVFYVAGEGTMIWYLLKKMGEKTNLFHCIGYSFIGFFFSGITPSATGGQPVQLYYMKKDGNSLSSGSVVLMTVAVIYKFVLVLVGIGILIFWREPLREYLQRYYGLYFVGLLLNIVVVIVLFLVMFSPTVIRQLFFRVEKILVSVRLWKESELRKDKMEQFLNNYQETVHFLKNNKEIYGTMLAGTFAQRCSVFLLTYIVYLGMGLSGISFVHIVLLQASIYVAVDMMPIPGAQGITETMYKVVFGTVFPGQCLVASMCVTRGISFYLIMIISFLVWGIAHLQKWKT